MPGPRHATRTPAPHSVARHACAHAEGVAGSSAPIPGSSFLSSRSVISMSSLACAPAGHCAYLQA